ncbi:triphosphoribosyl-dephospho-CoA synthase MdcB [Undibacterium sp. TJN25]|uniref:triphosphoribosyl-dephospho-CoA synthase MdcB n=1 Tax=Undibacterium sp. TJN25 TaxID=3413056 RepID=UPI003BEFE5D0
MHATEQVSTASGIRHPAVNRTDSAGEERPYALGLSRLAMRSLYGELQLYPKPGLVSPVDNGSHDDMTASTFVRSLFSLRHYFTDISLAGMRAAPFSELKQLGIRAEQRMLRATGGINTHRGAIFALGMLAAATAYCWARQSILDPASIRAALQQQWGGALALHTGVPLGQSHGALAAARYAAGGAREEAAMGFPSVFDIALPRLRTALDAGRSWEEAQIDALFALIAHISDTNLYHRGGAEGAALARQIAQAFLDAGASANPEWRQRAIQAHQLFVRHRLSPGGAADLLAAACLLHHCTDSQGQAGQHGVKSPQSPQNSQKPQPGPACRA